MEMIARVHLKCCVKIELCVMCSWLQKMWIKLIGLKCLSTKINLLSLSIKEIKTQCKKKNRNGYWVEKHCTFRNAVVAAFLSENQLTSYKMFIYSEFYELVFSCM